MNHNLIRPKIFSLLGVTFAVCVAFCAQAQAQESVSLEDWDKIADEYASEQIEKLSSANRLLFVGETLANITAPARLNYDFSHKGQYDDAYNGRVTINVNRIYANGRKDLTFRFLKGRKRVRFPPRDAMRANPLFMLFLERDAREMNRITGGSTLFFRSRIRHSLAITDVEQVLFPFEGESIEGVRITFKPFALEELSKRFEKYRNKTYIFILSPQVPGSFYQLRTFTKDAKGDILWEDRITFRSMELITKG